MHFTIDWTSLIVSSKFAIFALFYFVFGAIFQVQVPGGLYLEGRFNRGFFALPDWGAYIWRGLYMEGLILGILRYYITGKDLKGLCHQDITVLGQFCSEFI